MKILYDYQIFLSQKFGGVSRYFFELANHIEQLGESVYIPCIYPQNEYYIHWKNIPISKINHNSKYVRPIKKIINKILTIEKILTHKIDIIHPTFYDNYLIPFVVKPKLIIDVHDMIYELYPDMFSQSTKSIREKKSLYDRADIIISNSHYTKNDILKIYPNISNDKIKVIYRGSEKNTSITILPLPENFILFVGSRFGYKNFQCFFQGLKPLLQKNKTLFLVCTGGGQFSDEEKIQFKNANIQNQILQFNLSDSQLNYVYKKALCFVFPSLYEGFGLPILEAFKNNCPILLSQASCFPEIAEDAALYFNPNDVQEITFAIEKIIADETSAQELVKKGQQRLKNFSWEKCAHETRQVYKSVL